MSDAGKPEIIELEADQVLALEKSRNWLVQAEAELGATYLRVQDLKHALTAEEQVLLEAARRARGAEAQHAQVLRMVGEMRSLPPGNWTYDPVRKCLVRKGPSHA